MSSSPREFLAHSQFDDETREMLLAVYDSIVTRSGVDSDDAALALAERILAVVETGERSPERIEALVATAPG